MPAQGNALGGSKWINNPALKGPDIVFHPREIYVSVV
jgi:hypothetical protein